MSDIFSCVCARCRRIIPISDLTVFEGRDYHDSCMLQIIRSEISILNKKASRGTLTLIDNNELGDLLFLENVIRKDIENKINFDPKSSVPVFKGNTQLGLYSAMNPPEWKKLLIHSKSLEGTKYHMHKNIARENCNFNAVFEIMTDEHGHKYCMQVGNSPQDNIPKIEGKTKPSFPVEKKTIILQSVGEKQINMIEEPSVHGMPKKLHEGIDLKHDNHNTL